MFIVKLIALLGDGALLAVLISCLRDKNSKLDPRGALFIAYLMVINIVIILGGMINAL